MAIFPVDGSNVSRFPLQIGVVGFNEGNGHPYSWSAIFNSYDPAVMQDCGFPVIPKYLSKRCFPEEAIADASVTHIWCPNLGRAKHIAAACRIGTVAARPEHLLSEVDAVLIARDDVESDERARLVGLFLDAGMPLFVDKLLALTVASARTLLDRQQWLGQLFSGSALAYAPELDAQKGNPSLAQVGYLEGIAPKSWNRYAVHAIEPALVLLGPQGAVVQATVSPSAHSHVVTVRWESGLQATFTTLTETPIRVGLRLHGPGGPREIRFLDTFGAFRAALEAFVWQVRERRPHPSQSLLLPTIEVIEGGMSAQL